MEPIEVFELRGYVIESLGGDADFSIFTTEIRSYAIQRASAPDAVFATEIRAYLVQTGNAAAGCTVNNSIGYAIVIDPLSKHIAENSESAIRSGNDGVVVARTDAYTILGADNSNGLHLKGTGGRARAPLKQPGVKVYKTTVYTIDTL